jgi:hypothetical protein
VINSITKKTASLSVPICRKIILSGDHAIRYQAAINEDERIESQPCFLGQSLSAVKERAKKFVGENLSANRVFSSVFTTCVVYENF